MIQLLAIFSRHPGSGPGTCHFLHPGPGPGAYLFSTPAPAPAPVHFVFSPPAPAPAPVKFSPRSDTGQHQYIDLSILAILRKLEMTHFEGQKRGDSPVWGTYDRVFSEFTIQDA